MENFTYTCKCGAIVELRAHKSVIDSFMVDWLKKHEGDGHGEVTAINE